METAVPSPEAVAAQLDRILSSKTFGNSTQASHLLRFVVERTLEGRATEIKELVLGVEVFGRQSFDPRTDPIARVEASRLRQRLTSYYDSEGRGDAVRITLPKGSYVPVFEPILDPGLAPTTPVTSRSRQERWAWALSALFALAAVAFAWGYLRRSPGDAQVWKLSILPPSQAGFLDQPANLSPEGRMLAFTAAAGSKVQLWIRSLNSLDARPLPGTEDARFPFWSADSQSLGFFAGGKLKRIDIAGGAVRTICDAESGRGGTWNHDGVILFAPNLTTGLYRVAAAGGTPSPVTELDKSRLEAAHRWPQSLPDGTHFVYTVRSRRRENNGIYLGTLGSNDRTRLASAESNGVWVEVPTRAPFGSRARYLLYVRDGSLLGQRMDASRFQGVGEPFPVAGPVGYDPAADRAAFSVSENGVLAYSSNAGATTEKLIWRDRSGKELGVVDVPGTRYVNPSLSRDGRVLATASFDPDNPMYSLWLIDLAHAAPSRFTFDASAWHAWSPDGTQIAFSSDRKGHSDLYVKASSGTSDERLLLASGVDKYPTDWSRDGRFLLFDQVDARTNRDLWALPLDGGKPFPILQTTANASTGRFSPDGHWIAYTSNESGRDEVYVQTFPPKGGKRKISYQGGAWPEWRPDGTELFYISADRQVMAATLVDQATFTFAVPKPLFPASRGRVSGFAVTPDGQRFLMNIRHEEEQPSPVTVVINWTAGIR